MKWIFSRIDFGWRDCRRLQRHTRRMRNKYWISIWRSCLAITFLCLYAVSLCVWVGESFVSGLLFIINDCTHGRRESRLNTVIECAGSDSDSDFDSDSELGEYLYSCRTEETGQSILFFCFCFCFSPFFCRFCRRFHCLHNFQTQAAPYLGIN